MSQAPAPKRRGSLERVRAFLDERGLAERLVTFDSADHTKTAAMAAEAVGCELGQIVKSLVFQTDADAVVLALVAGDRRGDMDAIAAAAGATSVRFADADAVRAATGYAIGGVSPYDLPLDLPVLIDDSFGRYHEVWTAAGTPSSMARLTVAELEELSGGRVARISQG
jgi:Cys-tRNA(Pro) deacylase